MHIKTENYEWTHGRKPRGDGHWAFEIKLFMGDVLQFRVPGTYSEACKKVKAEARAIDDVSSITVLS